jgi:Rps23 Pro-64 3,4-dihydroxylase Tpa1-like proline 4-hydroxylase
MVKKQQNMKPLTEQEKKTLIFNTQAYLTELHGDIKKIAKAVGVTEEFCLQMLSHRELITLNNQINTLLTRLPK